MPSAIGQIGGALVGGLLSDSGGGKQTTETKQPWGPAQQPLIDSIKKGQTLQGYYEQNPFNQLQQTSLQNLYGDIDNYRQNIAPSGMALANRLMNSNYQRAPAGSEMGGFLRPERGMGSGMGGMGQAAGGGQGGALAGLLGQAGQGYSPLTNGGLLGGISGALGGAGGLMSGGGQDMTQGAGQGMQSSGLRPTDMIPTMRTNPGQAYGQIDFKALNPYTSGAIPEPKAPESNMGNLTDAEIEYLRRQAAQDQFRRDQYGYGDGGA